MVHAQQVQNAVQHQDAKLALGIVAELAGLGAGTVEGDGNVAEVVGRRKGLPHRGNRSLTFAAPIGQGTAREGKDVGGVIFSAKFTVQAAQFRVAGHQAIEAAAAAYLALQSPREPHQGKRTHSRRNTPERNRTAFWRGHGRAL